MTGNRDSQTTPDRKVVFFLDECVTPLTAEALSSHDFPVTSTNSEGWQGIKDPELIPMLRKYGYVWVTKDSRARRDHRDDLIKAGIDVVWLRGIVGKDRTKPKNFTIKNLLKMLAAKLDEIAEKIEKSRGPVYCLLYMDSKGIPKYTVRKTLDEINVELDSSKTKRRSSRGP